LGLKTGDAVAIETPGGRVVGTALVRHGIMRGVVAIPHGYGHRDLGARSRTEDGQELAALHGSGAGVNLNDLGLRDPTRKGLSVWLDPVSGTAVRQGLPARLSPA
jgi:tetrathionate reductase subunit A